MVEFNLLAIIIGASSYQQYIENFDAFGGGPLPDELVVLIEKCWQTVAAVAPSYGR